MAYSSPGEGKTHLSELLVDKLIQSFREPGKPLVLKHYCDTRNIRFSTELAVVLGLLNQMLELENADDLWKVIFNRSLGLESGMFSQSNLGSLWECLDDMIRNKIAFHDLYLVLDGLDECDEKSRRELAGRLRKRRERLPKNGQHSFKKVILSRHLNFDVQADFMVNLDLEENVHKTNGDIRQLVKNHYKLEEEKMDLFCTILTERAKETFLWIALAIPLLNDAKTQRKIVDKATLLLDKLFPVGLDAMYNRMLLDLLESRYDKYPRKITVDILHCLTVAMRPIIRMELEAITDFDNDTIEDTLNAFRHILARKKNSTNEAVELIHLSPREHLVCHSFSMLLVDICWSVRAVPVFFVFVPCLFSLRGCGASIFVGVLVKCFELVFGLNEKRVHCAMSQKCDAIMGDTDKGLKDNIGGLGSS